MTCDSLSGGICSTDVQIGLRLPTSAPEGATQLGKVARQGLLNSILVSIDAGQCRILVHDRISYEIQGLQSVKVLQISV